MESDKANQLYQWLLETLRQGSDFAQEQVPAVAWELVAWGRAWNTLEFVICAAVAVTCGCFLRRLYKSTKVYDGFEPVVVVPFSVMCVSLLLSGVSLYYSIQVWFAPRVYLLEYVAAILKGRK